jgi:hypothetical protein
MIPTLRTTRRAPIMLSTKKAEVKGYASKYGTYNSMHEAYKINYLKRSG